MKTPKISVIMPTYNGEKYIKEAIESVLFQDEADFEFIIINDCSSDNTPQIINEYAKKDERIKVISNEENLKLPKSLNKGFSIAKGEYLTWTSDDNIFKQKAFSYMSHFLDRNKEIDLISCSMDYIDQNGEFLFSTQNDKNRKGTYWLAGANNVGACFMYRKSIANLIGNYNPDYFLAEDYDYWARIAIYGQIYYSPENFYKYRSHPKSLTATKKATIKEKMALVQQKYSEIILNRANISNAKKAYMYYQMYKNCHRKDYLYSALRLDLIKSSYRLLWFLLNKKEYT